MASAEKEPPALAKELIELGPVVAEMTEAISTIKSHEENVSAVGDNMTILQTKVRDPYYTYKKKTQRLYLSDRLAEIGAAEIFTSNIVWLRALEHGGFSEDAWPYLQCLYECCLNYSNWSQQFAEELGKAKITTILVQDLQELKETWETDEKNKKIIFDSLRILYNMSRFSSIRPLFSETNTIESLIPYLEGANEVFKIFATLTLAYVVEEKKLNLVADPSVIRFIIEVFTKAVDDEMKKCLGFSAIELAMGIERLAVNDTPDDENKLTLVAEGVFPPLFKLMTEGDEEEQLHAVRAISQLAFHPRNREEIRSVITQLQELKTSGNPDIAKTASGALWQLRDAESRKQEGHVMLSYQWDHQEIVKQIKTVLKSNGYNVWMDIEQMGGSTFDAMAGAVEGAAVVLICMSRRYKESANCRRECEYAGTRRTPIIPLKMEGKYKPDGWLGILSGANLYYNFDSDESFEDVMGRLMKEIGDRGKGHTAAVTEVVTVPPKPERPTFHDWTQKDVRVWAQENQLEWQLGTSLDAKDLRFLQMMKKETPAWFYKMIKDDQLLTHVPGMRKLSDALDKLE